MKPASPTRAAERARAGAADGARTVVAAFAMLSRVRVPGVSLSARDTARSAALFPLVGAVLGALGGASAAPLARHAPPLLTGGVAVLVAALATGALHLDGLADAADSLGGRTAPDALRIMRDHTIGAYGTVALVLDLLLKATAIGVLAGRGTAILDVAVAGALARAAGVLVAALAPYARPVDSHAGQFTTTVGRGAAACALLLAVGAAAAGGTAGACEALAVTVVAAVVAGRFVRRIGGVTGDVLGAVIELGETAALAVAAIVRGGA
jgi:adenosylcobinamide-GDP ribazoletransferase